MFKMLLRARAAVQYMAVFLLLTLIGIVAFWWNSPNQMNQADSSQVAEYSHNLNQKQNRSERWPSPAMKVTDRLYRIIPRESADRRCQSDQENLDKYGLETRDFSLMISRLSDSFVNLLEMARAGNWLGSFGNLSISFFCIVLEFGPARSGE